MEQQTRRGNPNFGQKKAETNSQALEQAFQPKPVNKPKNYTGKYDPKKRYQFKLVETHEKAKPRDKDTNEILDNPYPPIYMITNNGVGRNPKTGEVENWRYIFGFNSIWVSDQTKPEPSKAQLENPKNFIEFRNGSLFVSGVNSALLDALMIQEIYDKCESPLEEKKKVYTLINEDDQRRVIRENADMAYLAEKAAREATLAEMIPIASAFGIDVDDPEENEDRIRTEFIFKAKTMPEQFSKQFVNPKNKYVYNFTQALREGIISSDMIPGKVVLVGTGKVYCEIKEGDVAEQLAQMLILRNSEVISLYSALENIAQGD